MDMFHDANGDAAADELLQARQQTLARLKNRIDGAPRWDFYKSFSNEHERIYALGACAYVTAEERKPPCSRAFFKLWEIACDMWADFEPLVGRTDDEPRRYAYVGEGPGSFIEAVVTMRARAGGRVGGDAHTGITLRSAGYTVPHWRLAAHWKAAHRVRISHGADGTGNVYRAENVDAFVADAGGPASCHLVTGDGGFDFSGNFNEQESSMLRMLVSEAVCALLLLRPGGAFVLKAFDTFNAPTRRLLGALQAAFRGTRVCKPRCSRPANAERYFVFTGFRGGPVATDLVSHLRVWAAGVDAAPDAAAHADALLRSVEVDAAVELRLCLLCLLYATAQIRHVEATLHNATVRAEEDREVAAAIAATQRTRAAEWCQRYMTIFPPQL